MSMFKSLLLPTDGSPAAEVAVRYGLDLAKALGGRVTLLTAVDLSPYVLDGGEGYLPELLEELTAEARDTLERAKALAAQAGVEAEAKLVQDRAVGSICREAAGHDLIVLGSHGRGGLVGLILGSVAWGVVRQGKVPLLLVRPDHQWTGAPRSFLLPVDGSPPSVRAVDRGLELAKALGAEVTFLHVLPPAHTRARTRWQEAVRETGRKALEAAMAAATAAGVPAHTRQEDGQPADVILQRSGDYDLLVMGTHGRGVSELWLGSVTQHVVVQASHPVLVVRP
ncbi:MAG: universal stress protein [Firmicutes bacterium]|nr:universal stress protein [Bacillota bacterium]